MNPFPIVVLISGRGSNLQSIIDRQDDIGASVAAVISNRPDAGGLEHARRANIECAAIDHSTYAGDRSRFDRDLSALIDAHSPRLVVLAGFMRILGCDFVQHYAHRLINIHPSLLPRFPGLDTHSRVIAAGEKTHGATVHFVTGELDGGPIIAQASVSVKPSDDADSLAARVLSREHVLLPKVIGWFANGRVKLSNGEVLIDGRPGAAQIND